METLLGSTTILLKDRKLAECLGKISERKQQAIEGIIILGISVSVMAKTLDLDEQVVRNYKNRGIDDLRDMMEGSDDE